MKHNTEISFPGPVWRMLSDLSTGGMVFEIPLTREGRRGFVFREQGSQLEEPSLFFPENSWELGAEAIYHGVLLLHGWEDPSMPLHRGLYAFDLEKGQALWQKEDLTFWRMCEQGPIVKSPGREGWILLDLQSGEIQRILGQADAPEVLAWADAFYEKEKSALHFPEKCSFGSKAFEKKVSQVPGTVFRELDFLEYGPYEFYAWHEQQANETFVQKLLVQKEGKVLHEEILVEGSPQVQLDSFFIFKEELFALKRKNQIRILGL